jgi:hypothetical protein
MSGLAQEPGSANPEDGFDWDDCHSDDMMGDWEPGDMMGGKGYGGMMSEMMGGMMGGMGPYMMGDWGYADPGDGTRLTLDEAIESVERYLAAYGNADLSVAEVMEFTGNFYAQVEEQSTGIHAFELLVNPYTGVVYPEPGPNMMWNAKYGHMGGRGGMMGGYGTPAGEMVLSPEEAVQAAQAYLDRVQPGLTADDHADAFYGYYTLHTLRDGQVVGMLSVHGTTGQVWYHTWHGDFIGMAEGHE